MKAAKIALAFLVILFSVVSTVIPSNNSAYAAELNSSSVVADGEYSVGYTILHATNNEASMADQYYTKPGKLIIKDGQAKVQVEYSNYITEFKVNGTPTTKLSEAGGKITAEFPVADLDGLTEAEIHVEVPAISYDHWYTVRFDFDTDSLPVQTPSEEAEEPTTTPETSGEEAEEPATTPETPGEEAEEPATTPETPGEEAEEPATTPETPSEEAEEPVTTPETPSEEAEEPVTTPETPSEEAGEETPAQPQDEIVYEDGEYDVDYTVLHGTAEEKSIADNYFTKPSKVIVKDGIATVQTEYSSLITEFTVEGKAPEIISNDGTKTVAEFSVASLNGITEAQIHVEIPAINYDHWYTVRFDFNTDNLPVVEEKEPLADGHYTIDYQVWKEKTDEASSMGNYLSKPAELIVENGKSYIQLNLSSSNFVTGFKTEINGQYVDAEVISQDDEAKTKVLRFEVENLSDNTNIQLAMSYGMNHVVRMVFDEASVAVKEQEETPEPTPGEGEEEPLADGHYTIDYKVWKENADEASSMGNYLSKPAKLIVENGKSYIQLNLSSSNFVTGFKTEVNGQYVDAEVISQDDEAKTKVLRFEVENLNDTTNIQLAMSYGMNHVVRMVFDESTITVSEPEETPEPTPGEGEEEPLADGLYTIDYLVWKENADEASSMGNYLSKPAKLIVENGKSYIQLNLSSSNFVTGFKTEVNGQYVDADVISQDAAANTKVLRFEVENVNDVKNIQLAMSYGMNHIVRMVFDEGSIAVDVPEENPGTTPGEGEGENPGTTPGEGEGENPGTTPGEGEGENPGTTPGEGEGENPGTTPDEEQGANSEFVDGKYDLQYSILHALQNEKSMADQYFTKPGKVTLKNGNATVQVEFSDYITEFKLNGKDAKIVSQSAGKTIVEFAVADLSGLTTAEIHVEVPAIGYDHWYTVRFDYDTSNLPTKSGGNDNTGGGNEEENGSENEEEEKPAEETPGNVDEDTNDQDDKGENAVLKNGEYTVDYSVLHASKNEKSMADSYFVKPGKLIVKDGKVVARLTIKTDFITEFLVGSKAVKVISESGDSKVVEFPVADLASPTVGNIHVVIPELNYDHWYEIRFLFDVSDLPVAGIENDFDQINPEDTNTTTPDETTNNNSEDNLEYNRDGDTNSEQTNSSAEASGKVVNAKTADTAQIGLYLLLLLSSIAVLIRKYRTRTL
ncbi:sortase B protein-sorting domain-containing protein [Niallia circulans]|uniref:Sortase B protein-sorting domain-containing protein n=1 Tax=Niallia circulans TaxID=1397 RepID=A0A553SFC3_NIACI|nr:NEAT domain-containing protein [Niallia circulans]TRZ35690.1 sortase B protein-sorting domain-containing protein [Niallia circulans]